jgi:dTDP-4-amino-4,6-dideoxygalactose transaminase
VPVHKQELYAGLGYSERSFPESERASRDVLSLPIHPGLMMQDLETIVQAVSDL